MADQKSAGTEVATEPGKRNAILVLKSGDPDRRFGGDNREKLGKDGCGY